LPLRVITIMCRLPCAQWLVQASVSLNQRPITQT
jgi:hypothetical protein